MESGAVEGRMFPPAPTGLDGYRKFGEGTQATGRMSLPGGGPENSGMHGSFTANGTGDAGAVTTSGAGGAVSADAGGVDSGEVADGKRRKRPGGRTSGEKGKGLRHFSLKVCEKVESKGRTTYNEVADELVAEITGPDRQLLPADQQQYDEKNIRRRVYDALNVLMAMDIISKEKKEIKWKGLPPSSGSHEILEAEKEKLLARLEKKRASQQELQEQVAAIERLIRRNETSFQSGGAPPGSGVGLPFILVQTRPQATVEVEISEDMQLVHFDFGSTPFELHDDSFVLRAMGLANPPLDDVFPPTTGVVTSPPGASGPGLQVRDASVALAATSSAPQAGLGQQGQPGGFGPGLTRSASTGLQQQSLVQQQPSGAGQMVYSVEQQGMPMGLHSQQGHATHQQGFDGLPQQAASGQLYGYQTGQYATSGTAAGSSMPPFGGYRDVSSQLQDRSSSMTPAQYSTQYGPAGFPAQPLLQGGQAQFVGSQQAALSQQHTMAHIPQQQQQQMMVQAPMFQQQSTLQGVGAGAFPGQQPVAQQFGNSGSGEAPFQQQQQNHQSQSNIGMAAQSAGGAVPLGQYSQGHVGTNSQVFYQQPAAGHAGP